MVDVDRPEPVKTDWQLLGRLIPFVQPQRLWLGLTVLHALEGVAVRVLTPFLLQQMMDSATDTGVQSLTKWFYVAGLVLVIDAGFAWAGRHAVARYGAFTARDLRDRVTAHIQRLPMGFLEAQHSGDLVSRLNSDVTKIESWLPGAIKALSQPLVFVGGVVYMLSISWKLLLASSILIPISALLYNQVSKPMEALARQQAQGEGRANAALQDMLAGSVTVKAFNLQTVLGKRFNRLIREIQRQALRLDWRRSVFVAVFLALRYIPQLIVPLYGGYLAFQGEITVGELLAANLVIWLVFLPIETLLDSIGRTRETLPSVSRVLSLLDEAAEPTGGKHFERLPDAPAIRVRGLSFAYPGQDALLTDITFDVSRGETVALVGPSGCGKSTLLKLLAGFYPPQSGTIALFGNDLTDVDLAEARERIALVAQETYLFPTTLAENIAYGRPGATQEEIVAAAKAANAHAFICEQPEGYQTQVGERGVRLSGGERQRIALARAILRDAPILLLDEPTSALDTQSESLVQEALERLMADRTVLIVAHRLSTFLHADRILVLGGDEEGGPFTIRERGTHAELIGHDTLYRQLYLRQMADDSLVGGAQA